MSVYEIKLKTHSREDITTQFKNIHACAVHGCKPVIMDIVAGRRKQHHFVARCPCSDDCNKIAESGQAVVTIWNKFNAIN